MNSIPNFVMMIGLPGSGKTYRAHRLSEQFGCDFIVCSSDEYRQRLFGSERDQEHNDAVFRQLHRDIKEYLSSGKNVIFDATNVSAKKRYAFLDSISSISCKKIAYVMPVGVQKSKERDALRERSVGFHVINKFASAFQFPQKYEGWDLICIDGYDTLSSPSFVGDKRLKDLAWARMHGFDQQNPHHRYDLSEHCERVAQAFPKDSIEYQAGILHDIAKTFPWVRTFSEDEIAHYYGHDCQGALWLLENLEILKCNTWDDVFEILFLVNWHMKIKDIKGSPKAYAKYKKMFGDERFERLLAFNRADGAATGFSAEEHKRISKGEII